MSVNLVVKQAQLDLRLMEIAVCKLTALSYHKTWQDSTHGLTRTQSLRTTLEATHFMKKPLNFWYQVSLIFNAFASYSIFQSCRFLSSLFLCSCFVEHAKNPQISINGIPRVGEQSSVSCNVEHTCFSAPPTLSIAGIPGTGTIKDSLVSDGIWKRTIEQTWNVEEEDRSVTCTVSYPSGQKATGQQPLNVECEYRSESL